MADAGAEGDSTALNQLAVAVADAAVVWVALAFGIDSSYIAGTTPEGVTVLAREAADAYGALSEDELAGVRRRTERSTAAARLIGDRIARAPWAEDLDMFAIERCSTQMMPAFEAGLLGRPYPFGDEPDELGRMLISAAYSTGFEAAGADAP